MLIDFNFRHFQPSNDLITYVSERFHRLDKFGRRSVRAEVVFSYQKKLKRIDVTIIGSHLHLHAWAESPDYFAAIDKVAMKLARQMERSKEKHQGSRRKAG